MLAQSQSKVRGMPRPFFPHQTGTWVLNLSCPFGEAR